MADKIVRQWEAETYFGLSDYWHGAGLSFSRFTDIATGSGSSEKEAAEDALEALAQNGWNTDSIDISDASEQFGDCECEDSEDCEHTFLVTIRVTEEEEE